MGNRPSRFKRCVGGDLMTVVSHCSSSGCSNALCHHHARGELGDRCPAHWSLEDAGGGDPSDPMCSSSGRKMPEKWSELASIWCSGCRVQVPITDGKIACHRRAA